MWLIPPSHDPRRSVVAEQDQIRALQSQYAIHLGPTPIVADAHPRLASHELEDSEPEISNLEISLLQVLRRFIRLVVGVTGQMNLPILADNASTRIHEDRRVEAAMIGRQLGVPQIEADA